MPLSTKFTGTTMPNMTTMNPLAGQNMNDEELLRLITPSLMTMGQTGKTPPVQEGPGMAAPEANALAPLGATSAAPAHNNAMAAMAAMAAANPAFTEKGTSAGGSTGGPMGGGAMGNPLSGGAMGNPLSGSTMGNPLSGGAMGGPLSGGAGSMGDPLSMGNMGASMGMGGGQARPTPGANLMAAVSANPMAALNGNAMEGLGGQGNMAGAAVGSLSGSLPMAGVAAAQPGSAMGSFDPSTLGGLLGLFARYSQGGNGS